MTGRCGVVVAHGRLADGLVSALARVAGPQESLWPLSNDGLTAEALVTAIEELIAERSGGREAVLFSDVGGGSCGQACRRLLEKGIVRAVFFGTNLPLLFEFLFLDDRSFDDLADAMVEKSREAVGVYR